MVGRFQSRAEEGTDRALWHERIEGKWQATTWGQARTQVEQVAAGLIALGVEKGDRVGLVGKNAPTWVAVDYGIQHAAACCVPLYATLSPEQVSYVLGHAGCRIYFVDDPGQLDKALAADLPDVDRIVGFHLGDGDDGRVMGLDRLLALGRELLEREPDRLRERMMQLSGDDLASLVYTSGTTGPPKGAMISHHNLTWTATTAVSSLNLRSHESIISYLPLCHVYERLVTTALPLADLDRPVWPEYYFIEDPKLLPEVLPEVRPTQFVAVPRIWEKFRARIEARLGAASGLQRGLFDFALRSGIEAVKLRDEGGRPSPRVKLGARLARDTVGGKLRETLGLERCWYAMSAAAPLSADVQRFFQALGLPLHQGWGMTETTAACTFQREDDFEISVVGLPIEGVEIKLDTDGEILVRGDNVFQGYYRQPDKTAETFADGFLRTGDVGAFTDDGRLKIVDRKKDIIITAGGKNIAPQVIEQRVKSASIIGEAMVIGDARPFLSALVSLDPEEIGPFLSQHGHPDVDLETVHEHPEVVRFVTEWIDTVNGEFSRVENVRKWTIVPGGFPADAITPTLKLKRRVVNEACAHLIEAMYAG